MSSKKKPLNSANNSFASIKRSSKSNLKSKAGSKHQLLSNRKQKQSYDKRPASTGSHMRDFYAPEQVVIAPVQLSFSNKPRYKPANEGSAKSPPSNQSPYSPDILSYSLCSGKHGLKVVKQKQIMKKHVDYKAPSGSFYCNLPPQMLSPSSGKKVNQSAVVSKAGHNLYNSRRMNCFRSSSIKSRDQSQYRIGGPSHTRKSHDKKCSSFVNPSDLTPLHSNCVKTVKAKHTHEDTLVGQNVYKVCTMESSLKKAAKKSLGLSSNQYQEYPTATDWYSSLVNGQEDNLEDLHAYFVFLHQKRRRAVHRVEASPPSSGRPAKHPRDPAKRRGGDFK